ncbi:hypothetical protein [Rubinisphaera italica]|uniref:Uncharacterized protein n=1 Tax=Rubinisphaera italica TaxID=2527969 RepID=A0A5C5XMU2_9PLAN|nr:hypothetical protein [Rubinisphaera italica]TWT63415.1 hypothetical protein Pan54_41680 [Rubinisphaera italica]
MAYPPTWIEDFVRQLAYSIFPQDFPTPLGCHYHQEGDCWEVAVFPSMRRVSGRGFEEESLATSAFSFDVQQSLALFEELHHLDWVTAPRSEENEAGPHLLFEGIALGEPVLIRVCAEIPTRFQSDPDLIVQAT